MRSCRPSRGGDPRKPESPTDLTKPSLMYALRQTIGEFSRDQCTDLAAALTYYAVLSLFPALVVVVSLLGVIGQGQQTSDTILQIVGDVTPGSAADTLRQPIEQVVSAPSAGFALMAGIVAGRCDRVSAAAVDSQPGLALWR